MKRPLGTTLILIGAIAAIGLGSTAAFTQQVRVESPRGKKPTDNELGKSADGRPWIRYGSSRKSGEWITTTSGTRVAVDDGIAWQGQVYYVSLTGNLIAAAAGTTVARWSHSTSAFWDRLGIEAFTTAAGEKVDTLALRSSRHDEHVEYRDLESGQRIGGTEEEAPGHELELAGSWKGSRALHDEPVLERVESAAAWRELHEKLFGTSEGAPPADLEIDFSTHVIVVVFRGKGSNCNGYSAKAFESDGAVILRAHAHTYQSMGDTPATWPYGVFAVPSPPGKPLVLERNTQNLIGGPALWREWKRWPAR